MKRTLLWSGMLILAASCFAQKNEVDTQKNEVDMVLGNTWSLTNTTLSTPTFSRTFSSPTNSNFTYQLGFARRLTSFRATDLSLELSAAGFPRHLESDFAAVFVVPGVKFSFVPRHLISPFVSTGVGFVHLSPSTNAAAFQFGGGFDVRTPVRFVSFRAEARDYLALQPDFASYAAPGTPPGNTLTFSSRHHVLVGGGAVLRF